MIKEISSLKNDLVKEVILLQEKSRSRKRKGLFIIEGFREIEMALYGGYIVQKLLFCEDIISQSEVEKLPSQKSDHTPDLIKLSLQVYQKLAHRKKTEGILAITEHKELSLNDLHFNNKALILVAEASEKPGNIGALLRTADAAKADAVIIANPKTDLYNPNIIRSSIGCVFTNKIAMGSTDEIIDLLKKNKVNIFAAALDDRSVPYHEIDFTGPTAIVVGTEATGLDEIWLKNAYKNIIIPMQGKIDSLNVSVSAAILIFEAKRQRNFQ